ncbi:MAG: hypothetical protein QW505_05660 [Thermoplasmata archaeon]
MPKVLSEPEAEKFIIQLLSSRGKMTTREIELIARKQGKRCPDETVLFLTKLRSKGKIKGELSQEKRGWLWWV